MQNNNAQNQIQLLKPNANLYVYNQPVNPQRNQIATSSNNKKMRIKSRPASVKVRGEKVALVGSKNEGGDQPKETKQSYLKVTGTSQMYGKEERGGGGVYRGIQIDDQTMKTSGYQTMNSKARPSSNGGRISVKNKLS